LSLIYHPAVQPRNGHESPLWRRQGS
jgi:hypothetical protein